MQNFSQKEPGSMVLEVSIRLGRSPGVGGARRGGSGIKRKLLSISVEWLEAELSFGRVEKYCRVLGLSVPPERALSEYEKRRR